MIMGVRSGAKMFMAYVDISYQYEVILHVLLSKEHTSFSWIRGEVV